MINRALLLLLLFTFSTHAQLPPAVSRITEFQKDDISLVLRTLARQGHLELIITEKLTGTVTLRVENKAPREIIEIVARIKKLVVNERDGILYISPPGPERFIKHAAIGIALFLALLCIRLLTSRYRATNERSASSETH